MDQLLARLHARPADLTEAEADRLAEALGDLPLAIGQAAELLAETRISVEAYLDELGRHAAELLREGPPPSAYPAPMAGNLLRSRPVESGPSPSARCPEAARPARDPA